VQEISHSGSIITFTGTGFLTGWTGTATVNDVESDSVSITSDTEAVASFTTYGIPQTTEVPSLHFTHEDGYALYASINSTITFAKTTEIVSSTAALECSYAGGCSYAIESSGLYGTLQADGNEIRMCGSLCVLNDDESNADYAVCSVPSLATTFSTENYKITQAHDLNGL